MQQANASLSSFSTGEINLEPDPVSVARCATLRNVPDRDGTDWESADEEWGLTTRRPASELTTSGKTYRASPQQIRWIIAGDVGEYVDKHGDETFWRVPSNYGGFNDFDTYVGYVDGLCDGYGWGIDGRALERALRVLIDGGRYNASRYRVFPCGRHPWILTGPEGTLLCSPVPVDDPSDGQRRTSTVDLGEQTLTVEEENQQVLSGIKHYSWLLECSRGTEVLETSYEKRRDRTLHTFHGENAENTISASDLATLGRIVTDSSRVFDSEQISGRSPEFDRSAVTIEWEGPDHQVGDVVDGDIVAGYESFWERPEASIETVATVRTYRV